MNVMKFKTIQDVHDALDSKKISVTELTTQFLDRAEKDRSNAFLTVCRERAMKQARELEHELSRAGGKVPRAEKPLFGVPMAIKDNIVIEGVRTTCASKMLENYIPPYTATAMERLEGAGAVTLAKANLDEFAMGSSNENSAFGPVQHPTHPDRVPGGSSGGSAAAVGAGLAIGALGSETGGSVRLPASFCGVVGVKPTYGRVSRYGLVAFGSSLDQIGQFANSVEDSAQILNVMAGPDPMDATSVREVPGDRGILPRDLDLKGLKIGVPKEYFIDGISAEVSAAVEASLKWYEKQGAKLVPISLPHTQYAVSTYYIIAVSEASSNLARFDGVRYGVRSPESEGAGDLATFYKKNRALFGAEVKRRIILGTFALSSGYYDAYFKRACQVRALLKRDFDEAFKQVDVVASPVSPTTAFKAGEKTKDPLQMYLVDIFTIPANMAGLPAISVPCGKDRDGLSIGLHLMARPFEESLMFSAARALEKGFTHAS